MKRRRFLECAAAGAATFSVSVLGLNSILELIDQCYHGLPPSVLDPRLAIDYLKHLANSNPRLQIPASGCYIGVHIRDFPGVQEIESFERMVGKKISMLLLYCNWGASQEFPSARMQTYAQLGLLPVLSWEPRLWPELTPLTLQSIIDHKHDEYLDAWAREARTYGHPFFLRFGHEMNGDWSAQAGANNFGPNGDIPWYATDSLNGYYGDPTKPDGPERFVDAWKHIHDIFAKNNANNAIWVWSPNYLSFPNLPFNVSENYYPGDEYVDWVGIDLYNFGWPEWQSFDDLFSKSEAMYVYSNHKDKPFMLSEFGCAEAPLLGDKATWIRDAFSEMKDKYTSIKAAIWFSRDKSHASWYERDWRVDSSPESLSAFRSAISDKYFLERTTQRK